MRTWINSSGHRQHIFRNLTRTLANFLWITFLVSTTFRAPSRARKNRLSVWAETLVRQLRKRGNRRQTPKHSAGRISKPFCSWIVLKQLTLEGIVTNIFSFQTNLDIRNNRESFTYFSSMHNHRPVPLSLFWVNGDQSPWVWRRIWNPRRNWKTSNSRESSTHSDAGTTYPMNEIEIDQNRDQYPSFELGESKKNVFPIPWLPIPTA
jgi:hypothetical protein